MNKTRDKGGIITRELILTILILIATVLLSRNGKFDQLNWKFYDILVARHRAEPVHRDNVVFLCIDQKSLDIFDEEWGIGWPWPREFHGVVVDYLARAGAKAVVFDVIFSERDIDRDEITGDDSDNAFSRAIGKSDRTYLAVAALSGIQRDYITGSHRFALDNPEPFDTIPDLPVYDSAVFPLDTFAEGAKGLGLVNMEPDRDGIHRRYPLVSHLGEKYVPSLAFAVARDVLDDETLERNILGRIGDERYIDDEGMFFINWYGNGGPGRDGEETDAVFKYYSYSAALISSLREQAGEAPVMPPDTFKDKIVIIGSNAAGLFDLKATPFTHKNLYPGMEIHATAIENMLDGSMVPRMPKGQLLFVMIIVTALVYSIDRFFKSLRIFIALYIVISALELGIAYLLYTSAIQLVPVMDIFGGITTLTFLGLVISGYFKETREKRLLRRSFGRYVNETVMHDILANPTAVDYSGREIDATIMATDIAGFTSISEKLKPREVVTRLNDYLSEVSETLIDNGAYINKYIGDAILALYGAFGETDHGARACYAALRAREIVNRKAELAKKTGDDPMITRFGITTGLMTMGNIGSERKLEYTVIGDTVNTAFRFEGLNKFYRTTIIVGGRTREYTGDNFEFRLLDSLRVKGKEKSEDVYELLGVKGEVPMTTLYMRDSFEAALKLYRNREFEKALTEFERLHKEGDETSDVFTFRCRKFIEEPPPPEWNGVWVMLRK